MSEKILLIDGHSIVNRAFYGITNLTNAEGMHTNAIYGFLNTMFKIIDEEKPDYLTVAFDVKAPTFRHEMFQEYKGTRKPMPQELHEQVPVLKEVLHAMGIATMEKAGLEADDLLGTVAKKSEAKGMKVTILSGDRDLLQLATDEILVRIPKTKGGVTEIENYHTEDVLNRYQVSPLQIIELKALMGDTADNIPGIPGVGEKTATNLIVQYGSIENAYEHVEEIKPNRAKESLKNHYDLAQISKTLATINIEAEFPYDWEEARLGDIYTQEAYEWIKRLEFKQMLNKFQIETPVNETLEASIEEICDLGRAEEIFGLCKKAEVVAFDVQEEDGQVTSVAFTISKDETYVIFPEGMITSDYLLQRIQEILAMEKRILCYHLKDKLSFLKVENRENFFDVAIAAYLLNPLKSEYSMEDLAGEFLNLDMPKMEERGKGIYLGYRSLVCYEAKQILEEKLKEQGMLEIFETMEMPLVFTLHEMEKLGIQAEKEELEVYGKELGVRILELEKEIHEQSGETFNINSPKQLGVILFEKMGMKGGKKTKTGYSTSAEVLEKLAPEHPIVSSILEYRQLTKLKSTYADGLVNYIEEDGRIHTTFQQTITATGRLSSIEPNLQNIPIRMEIGRLIRKVFVPKKDYVFLDADYSQIELRVLAHMSGDEKLIQAYNEAQDIHRITASQVFHIPFDEVTALQRRSAKAVNFGIIYGISSFGLSQDLSISRKEAKEYIERYFETYPKIKSFLDGLVEEAKETGYVTTLFGRKRPVPELKSSNFMQRGFGERVAMNAPIQGTAADIIKIAMIRVEERLAKEDLKSKLILQVHDELLVEVHKDEVEKVKQILAEEMQGAANMAVPLEIDMKQGENWYEAH